MRTKLNLLLLFIFSISLLNAQSKQVLESLANSNQIKQISDTYKDLKDSISYIIKKT